MLAINNVGPGTYPFVLDGGNYQASASSSNWNSGDAELQYVDELGQDQHVTTWTSDHYGELTALPIGSYQIVVTSSTGVSVALARIPA